MDIKGMFNHFNNGHGGTIFSGICINCKCIFYTAWRHSCLCSNKCLAIYTSIKSRISKKCTNCGIIFFRRKSQFKYKKKPQFYCTLKCMSSYQKGVNHPGWKGGAIADGYKKTFTNGKWKVNHRIVMEKAIGRKLLSSEIVHHINHNKLDNRKENLVIMEAAKHSSLHSTKINIFYNGKTQSLKQWAKECKIKYVTLWNRIYRYKWNIEKSLSPFKYFGNQHAQPHSYVQSYNPQ